MTEPLQAIDAERSVLGACLGWEHAFPRIQGQVGAGDFARADHRAIFAAIEALAAEGRPVDTVTVAEHLEYTGRFDDAGGLVHLVSLVDSCPSAANVVAYAGIVHGRALKRRIVTICHDITERAGTEKPEALLAALQEGIDSVTRQGLGDALDFVDVLSAADDVIEAARQAATTGNSTGVPTGLSALDRRIGGFMPGRLVVLAARPSIGKTALALQCALHAAKQGHAVGICSLEEPASQIGLRGYSNVLQVNGTGLRFGDADIIAARDRALHGHGMTRWPVFVDDFTCTLAGIIARAHEWRHRRGIELLVVDYLQLIEGLDGDTQTLRIAQATRALKQLAKRLNVAVLLLSQLNRKVEDQKRRPLLSDLRDSGSIEQDCDVAIFLHAEDDSAGEDKATTIEIGVLKNRYGRRGWLPQIFEFDGRTQCFAEAMSFAA